MVASEKITLRMEMFQSSLVDKFKGLRVDDQFLDCTLVCGKARIKAHRDSDLTSIIDFMYCGEANVLESDLERFLDSAKDLKVQGLSPDESSDEADEWNLADGAINSTIQSLNKPGNKRIKQEVQSKKSAVRIKQEAHAGGGGGGEGSKRPTVSNSPAAGTASSDTQDAIKSLLLGGRASSDSSTPSKTPTMPQQQQQRSSSNPNPALMSPAGTSGLQLSSLSGTSGGIQLSSIPFTSAGGIQLSSQHQSMEQQQQQHQLVTSMAGQHQQLLGQLGSGLQVTSVGGQQQLGSLQRDSVTIPIRLPLPSSISQNQQPQTSYIQVSNYGGAGTNHTSQSSMVSLALQQQRLLTRPPAVSQAGARIRGQLPPGIQAQVPIQLENLSQFRLSAPQGLNHNYQGPVSLPASSQQVAAALAQFTASGGGGQLPTSQQQVGGGGVQLQQMDLAEAQRLIQMSGGQFSAETLAGLPPGILVNPAVQPQHSQHNQNSDRN